MTRSLPMAVLALWALAALAAPWLPLTPDAVDLPAILAPPGMGWATDRPWVRRWATTTWAARCWIDS